MNSFVVLKKPRAEEDLLDIFEHIGERNLAAAEKFLEAAERAFGLLSHFPLMGKPWKSSSPRLANIRSWPVPKFKNYLIFYRPIKNGIEVLHVLYGRRNLPTILEMEEPEEEGV
jgi:toxin ParE1/3/4